MSSIRRLPVLSWGCMFGSASTTRCSQPCTGITGKVFDLGQKHMALVHQTNTTDTKTLFILVNITAKAKKSHGIAYMLFYVCVGLPPQGKCALQTVHAVVKATKTQRCQHTLGLNWTLRTSSNIHVVQESYNQLQELCQSGVNEKT